MTGPSRRTVLRGTLAAVGAVGLAGASSGCARSPAEPDELEAPLAAARADAARAAAAVAGDPALAARLTPVADARRAHAEALATEIRRARPDRAAAVDAPPSATPGPVTTPGSAGPAATVRAIRDGLGAARDAGAALALGTTRYRCGLLASIAASCAGLAETLA